MEQKKTWDIKNALILAAVVAVLSTFLGWFLNRWYGPKNKEGEDLVKIQTDLFKSQNEGVAVLKNGFSELVNTLKEKQQIDPASATQINIYATQLAQLVKATNNIASEYKLNVTLIDTVVVKLLSQKEGLTSITPNELKISVGDNNLTQIDEINTIAIKKEHSETGSLTIMLNGSQTSIGKGGNRILKDGAGKEFKFYYKGKFEGEYVFLLQK
jgi:hypothetical protein